MPATASPTPLALLQNMSLLSLPVESTAHSSFPADASRFAKHSSLSRSHSEGRRLELLGSNGRAHIPRIRDGNRGRSFSGRKNADLVERRLSTLCSAKWEEFDDGPGGGTLEELASGCFLSDFEQKLKSNNHTEVTFSSSGWNKDAATDSFRQHHGESSRETPFQSKVENSFVFEELRKSLGRLDGPGEFIGTGSRIFNRGSEAPAPSSVVMDRSFQTEGTDPRNEDVKVRPKSLRMLKRKHSISKTAYGRKRPMLKPDAAASAQLQNTEGFKERLAGVGDSFKSAFSSSMFMIKTLQSHLLGLRKLLFCEDLQDVLRLMHTEMQESFMWLFQQVFSCTPKLMLLTMVLVADFTVHSMSKHVALAEPPGVSVTVSKVGGADISKAMECLSLEDTSAGDIRVCLHDLDLPSRLASDGGEGNGGSHSLHVGGGGTDGQSSPEISSESRAMRPEDDTCGGDASLSSRACDCEVESGAVRSSAPGEDPSLVSMHWKAVSEGIDLRLEKSCHIIELDQETKRMLVAPVSADLESDNYTCYDRTDLAYQYAIGLDPGNPLLLANYAQFLYLVRHDHNRAEDLFQRAMRADPVDGEVMGRFASFLWVAKGNLAEADRAYRAAVAADPTSCFHASSYAHFLWNSGEEEEESCQVNTRSA